MDYGIHLAGPSMHGEAALGRSKCAEKCLPSSSSATHSICPSIGVFIAGIAKDSVASCQPGLDVGLQVGNTSEALSTRLVD
jgi:hypothetical protein